MGASPLRHPRQREGGQARKKGGALQQEDTGLTYEVAKSYIKCHLSTKLEKDHPSHQKGDAFHQLPRHAQVTIHILRTGHNRLRHHMYHKFKVGDSDMCTCGTAPMTAEHVLQECPSYKSERTETWELTCSCPPGQTVRRCGESQTDNQLF